MRYGHSPRQKDFFEGIAESWDEVTKHDGEKVDYISDILGISEGDRILDVGTGTGVMVPYYEERMGSGSVVAVDYSPRMIGVARSKYPAKKHPNVEFLVADLYDLGFDGEFDIAVCYSCFPHFVDKEGAIRKLAGAVRTGGRVAIAHSDSAEHINNVHRNSSEEVAHDMLPPMADMVSMMGAEGLDVLFTRDDGEYYICVGEKRP